MAFLQVEDKIKEIETSTNVYAHTKADNIKLDTDTSELYLTANRKPIRDQITVDDLSNALADNIKLISAAL